MENLVRIQNVSLASDTKQNKTKQNTMIFNKSEFKSICKF